MMYEKSCGAVVVDTDGDRPKYLCVLKNAGHWSLPKGHADEDENEKVAAVHKVKAETGLDIEFIGEFRTETRYSPKPGVMKTVVFFLAKPAGGNIVCEPKEITACEWLTLEQARDRMMFQDFKDILDEADAYLKGI